MKILGGAGALILFGLTNPSFADSPPTSGVLATLERGACLGWCPVYKLTIFSDGRVEYVGRQHVKRADTASATLSPTELTAIVALFGKTNYFELDDDYRCVTDTPVVHTFYDDGTHHKAVEHERGCDQYGRTEKIKAQAQALTRLESEIDRITNSATWVGTQSEREQLRPHR